MVTISSVEAEEEKTTTNRVEQQQAEDDISPAAATTTAVDPMPPSLSTTPDGWTEMMGKDLLMKSLQPPENEENAIAIQHQDLVLVDWVGFKADSPTMDSSKSTIFHKAQNVWVTVGDKDVVPALEMAIRFAHEKETLLVWSHSKFAYGASTRTRQDYELPSYSNVQYEITIRQVVPSEERQQDYDKWTLVATESKKNLANDAYVHEWAGGQGKSRILYLYQKAAKELELLLDSNNAQTDEAAKDNDATKAVTQQKQKATELLLDCLNNICAVQLRAKEYHASKAAAVKVLERDPSNFKGLIRAAKAALLDPASSYDEVDAAIEAAAEQASNAELADVKKLQTDFRRRKRAYEQKSQQMYAKALNSSSGKKLSNDDETKNKGETAATKEKEPEPQSETAATMPEQPLAFSWSNWRTWPWSTIGAYAFQLSMPFVMYYMATRARKNNSATGIVPDEFQSSGPSPSFALDEF